MLRDEVLINWNNLKTKIKKDNFFGSDYQTRLGTILLSLNYRSLRPTVNWEELELAITRLKEQHDKTIQEIRRPPEYCMYCEHCKCI